MEDNKRDNGIVGKVGNVMPACILNAALKVGAGDETVIFEDVLGRFIFNQGVILPGAGLCQGVSFYTKEEFSTSNFEQYPYYTVGVRIDMFKDEPEFYAIGGYDPENIKLVEYEDDINLYWVFEETTEASYPSFIRDTPLYIFRNSGGTIEIEKDLRNFKNETKKLINELANRSGWARFGNPGQYTIPSTRTEIAMVPSHTKQDINYPMFEVDTQIFARDFEAIRVNLAGRGRAVANVTTGYVTANIAIIDPDGNEKDSYSTITSTTYASLRNFVDVNHIFTDIKAGDKLVFRYTAGANSNWTYEVGAATVIAL